MNFLSLYVLRPSNKNQATACFSASAPSLSRSSKPTTKSRTGSSAFRKTSSHNSTRDGALSAALAINATSATPTTPATAAKQPPKEFGCHALTTRKFFLNLPPGKPLSQPAKSSKPDGQTQTLAASTSSTLLNTKCIFYCILFFFYKKNKFYIECIFICVYNFNFLNNLSSNIFLVNSNLCLLYKVLLVLK